MSEWNCSFAEQETWVFNTYYYLYGKDGPNVHRSFSWWSRLDELAKCVGAATSQSMRLVFADAVISIEGMDLWNWMRFLGQTAPSEQQMVKMLTPNIEAAWRGEDRTWTLDEAQDMYRAEGGGWSPDSYGIPPKAGQPTPGVFVWRNCWKRVAQKDVAQLAVNPGELPEGVETKVSDGWAASDTRSYESSLHDGVGANVAHFLSCIRRRAGSDASLGSAKPPAVGVLLEYSGAALRFLSTRPLATADAAPAESCELPDICVTMLGGPKGISAGVIDVIRRSFKACDMPLLEIALGEQQQMAHVCMGYLRVEDQCGRYKAALCDLFRLGHRGYAEFMSAIDAALPGICASSVGEKRKRVE
eukprot:TRINITY_DN14753_c1_g3_i1.p1 TRINITY_DN14753_c1_g3~~TRINITY_DN14753_c1_g3_i1.p1  ORF type:complete len:359 (-),score=39.45 TRINITY_DN14753_c1_g3_i1:71-1147(-)